MQIACFLQVAQVLSFVRAAEALETTQPVVSYQIKSLEQELGLQLFIRTNRNVSLTAAGQYLYAEMGPLVEKFQDILCAAREMQRQQAPLTLLIRRLTDYSRVSKTIKAFSELHPLLPVDITTCDDRTTYALLAGGAVQMAYCYQYEVERCPAVRFVPLDRSYYYVLVSKSHPLAAYKYLTLRDLSGQRLALADTQLQKKSPLLSRKNLERYGIVVPPAYSTFDGMLLAVESGVACTILPSGKSKRFSGLVKILLQGVDPLPLGLAYLPASASPALLEFLELAQQPEVPRQKPGPQVSGLAAGAEVPVGQEGQETP